MYVCKTLSVFVYFLAVLPKPLLTISLDHKIKLRRGHTAQLVCQFKTVTIEKFTIFHWRKDDEPINAYLLKKYRFAESTVPFTDFRMWSKLTIINVTEEDEGSYTCYCEYSSDVMIQIGITHSIMSDSSTTILELTGFKLVVHAWSLILLQ